MLGSVDHDLMVSLRYLAYSAWSRFKRQNIRRVFGIAKLRIHVLLMDGRNIKLHITDFWNVPCCLVSQTVKKVLSYMETNLPLHSVHPSSVYLAVPVSPS